MPTSKQDKAADEQDTPAQSADIAEQSKAAELLDDRPLHEAALRAGGEDPADRHETFKYVVVVQANPLDDAPAAGPDTAATQAAVNGGYRPIGMPTVSGPTLHEDGESQVYTWSVPVLKVK